MSAGSLRLVGDLGVLIGSLEPEALDIDPKEAASLLYGKEWTDADLGKPVIVLIRHGRDDQRAPRVSTNPATASQKPTTDVSEYAAQLQARINPTISSSASLKHCEATGFTLAEFLTKGGITADQLVFLSSPSERALKTCSCVISGVKHFYSSANGSKGNAASGVESTIIVIEQLREALFRSPRDWRAKKSEIKERYPTADVSYLTEEEDPAQKGDLHLEPKADTEMTWEEFRSLPRGVRESTEGFQTRVNTAKEVLGELTESRRQRTGKQPVLVCISHFEVIGQFLNLSSLSVVEGRRVRANAMCHVGTYERTPSP